jgi:HK97 family phage major capsid protein
MPVTQTRGAVAYAATKKSEAESWDGAAAVERLRKWASSDGSGTKAKIDWEKYRKGFAWYDPENAENFEGYKVAHHDVADGSLVVAWKGVVAAAAVCMGARGGVDLPSGDMPAVKSHLGKHYGQFDQTAPWEAKPKARAGAAISGEEATRFYHFEPLRSTRAAASAGAAPSTEDRIIISTETAIHLPWADEVLGHGGDEVDMSMATVGLSLLLEHGGPLMPRVDPLYHVGVVKDIRLENQQLTGVPQFTPTPEGQRAKAEYEAGGRLWVSVGWAPGRNFRTVLTARPGLADMIRRVGWMPCEVTMPSVPADPNARTGRNAAGLENYPVEIEGESPEEDEMITEPNKAPQAGAAAAGVADPVAGGAEPGVVVTRSAEVMPPEQVILNYAAALKLEHRAAEFIAQGLSVKDACAKMLEIRKAEPLALPSAEQLGLNKREVRSFSYARALQQAIVQREGGKPEGLEYDLSKTIDQKTPASFQRHGGFFIPLRLEDGVQGLEAPRRTRSMGSLVAGAGADFVFAQRGELIELLQERAILFRLGVNVNTGLTGPVEWPKVVSDMDVNWMGENPSADADATELATGTILMSPKALIGVGLIPRQLIAQSAIDIETRVKNGFAGADARAISRGGLRGTGTAHQPLGILNTPGVQSVDWDADAIYDTLETMLGKIADVDEDDDVIGFATTRLMASLFRKTLEFSVTGSVKVWTGPFNDGLMLGYRAVSSNQCGKTLGAGSDEHGLIAGVWSQMEVGLWGAVEFIPDIITLAGRGQVKINTWHMADCIIRHPEAFCLCAGAKPA